jgi:hypothetical protein
MCLLCRGVAAVGAGVGVVPPPQGRQQDPTRQVSTTAGKPSGTLPTGTPLPCLGTTATTVAST